MQPNSLTWSSVYIEIISFMCMLQINRVRYLEMELAAIASYGMFELHLCSLILNQLREHGVDTASKGLSRFSWTPIENNLDRCNYM